MSTTTLTLNGVKNAMQIIPLILITTLLSSALHAQSVEGAYIGMEAPAFTLNDLQGNEVNLDTYRGKYVVIHVAVTWCPFCNAEAPYLEQLYKDYYDRDVRVLIIDVKEPKELVQARLQDRFNFSFPVLLDTNGSVTISYAPKDVLPELSRDEVMLASNLLIDPNGTIQFISLLDSRNFDARLVDLKSKLNELLLAN